MTRITIHNDVVTLINIFSVEPAQQQQLLDILVEATEQVMKDLPGFVSANSHRSTDGSRVVNYAQWRSREDFEAMPVNPAAQAHMAAAAELATFEPHLYEVAHIDEATTDR